MAIDAWILKEAYDADTEEASGALSPMGQVLRCRTDRWRRIRVCRADPDRRALFTSPRRISRSLRSARAPDFQGRRFMISISNVGRRRCHSGNVDEAAKKSIYRSLTLADIREPLPFSAKAMPLCPSEHSRSTRLSGYLVLAGCKTRWRCLHRE